MGRELARGFVTLKTSLTTARLSNSMNCKHVAVTYAQRRSAQPSSEPEHLTIGGTISHIKHLEHEQGK